MNSSADQLGPFETFYQGNSGHAIILLPGLCGSELEMGAIPRMLRQANHTYVTPRILGYSAHTGITEFPVWINAVEDLISTLEATHESVSLIGISMGATLALAVAGRNSNAIRSISLLSPVVLFDGWSVPWYHPFLSMIYRLGIRNWHYKESEPFGVKNKELRRHIRKAVMANSVSELGAAHLPAKHLYQSLRLIDETKYTMSYVTSDTLIIHAIDDETASPKNPDMILAKIKSETRRIIWLGNSYHMITVDNEREIVANEVSNFLSQSIERIKIIEHLNANTPQLIIKNRSEI
jgi:carboxylesterase